LFLIVLGTLIVSILVGNWFSTTEGMVSYNSGVAPLTTVQIPNYTNTTTNSGKRVNLVFDNIYFDTDNANLLEINGNTFTGNVDLTGNTIQSISVSSRNDNNNNKQLSTMVWNTTDPITMIQTESKRVFKPSYYEYDYITTSSNTDKYQVFVLPWNNSTYIHVINLTTKTNVITACFGPNGNIQHKKYEGTKYNTLPFTRNIMVSDTEPLINSYLNNSNIF
jgi:hypothetical protein